MLCANSSAITFSFQAKGNITIQLQECKSTGPVTPKLLCSLPFFKNRYSGCFVCGAQGMQEPLLSPPCPRLFCREASPQLPLANSTARLETGEDGAELCRDVWAKLTRAKLICLTSFQYVRLSLFVSHRYGKSHGERHFIDFCRPFERGSRFGREHCCRKLP